MAAGQDKLISLALLQMFCITWLQLTDKKVEGKRTGRGTNESTSSCNVSTTIISTNHWEGAELCCRLLGDAQCFCHAFKATACLGYPMMTANGNTHKLKGSCFFHFDYGYCCSLCFHAGPAHSISCSPFSFWLYWARKGGSTVGIWGGFCWSIALLPYPASIID